MPPLIKKYFHTTTWLTPPHVLDKLGMFDLDPCCPTYMPWVTAKCMYREKLQDGLKLPWRGRVWLNPPFGRKMEPWQKRMVEHGNGIMLVPAATDTKWFTSYIWEAADAVCFMRGRLTFLDNRGQKAQSVHPSGMVLAAYGLANVMPLYKSGFGKMLILKGLENASKKEKQSLAATATADL